MQSISDGPLIDGLPVKNMLVRNERTHALSAIKTLRECISHNAQLLSSRFLLGDIELAHPSLAVHSARLTLSSEEVVFSVTHGKHKSFVVSIEDRLHRSALMRLTDLQTLIDAWEIAIRERLSPQQETEMADMNRSIAYPAIAAATTLFPDWRNIKIFFGCEQDDVRITLDDGSQDYKSFTTVKDDRKYDTGFITPVLAARLLQPRPYIALHGRTQRRSASAVEFTQRFTISLRNNLDAVAKLRFISESQMNGWIFKLN